MLDFLDHVQDAELNAQAVKSLPTLEQQLEQAKEVPDALKQAIGDGEVTRLQD